MRLGIDVGGTNTDAVIIDDGKVLSAIKRPTTAEPQDGIADAVRRVLNGVNVSANQILSVMLGTTHFTNAFVQRKRLSPVGILRLGLPASRGLSPMVDWPVDVRQIVHGHTAMVRGGHEYDGSRIAKLDEQAVIDAALQFRDKGISTIAITGIFSPVIDEGEKQAAELVRSKIPDARITISSELGRIGLIERENATIMNASLVTLAESTVIAFQTAFQEIGITAPFFISQNDGTLMEIETLAAFPILTFSSGPTNSIRGAAFLSGLDYAVVADIGGTTTDIGMLKNGFPRESAMMSDIGGIRTNFRMPDIFSIGLGGGSYISMNGDITVGPKSVGYELTSKAMVFGGNVLTATDIAVAAGYAQIGDRSSVCALDGEVVNAAVREIHRMLETNIERVKTDSIPTPLILVGGGSILIDQPLCGVSEVMQPEFAGAANAVGASIAKVGAEIDKVVSLPTEKRNSVLDRLYADACSKAETAGAAPSSIEVADVEIVPLPYVPGNIARVRVKAVGDLNL